MNISFWKTTRSGLWLYCFCAYVIGFMNRCGINIAIISMVKLKEISSSDFTTSKTFYNTSVSSTQDRFDWSQDQIGKVLGGYYIGYSVAQILGGLISQKFGGKWVLSLGMLGQAIFTLMIPLASNLHANFVISIRVFSGFSEGLAYPAYNSMINLWAPKVERTIFGSAPFSGCIVGIIVVQIGAGYLCELDFMGGWPFVFYISGILGVLSFIVLSFKTYSYPEEHPSISRAELDFIKETAATATKSFSTPWKSIVTSKHFWAYVIGDFANQSILFVAASCLPQYVNNVLQYSIEDNGLISSVPLIFFWIVITGDAFLSDEIRRRKILSTIWVRRVNQIIGNFIPALLIIMFGYLDSSKDISVLMLILLFSFAGFCYAGATFNHLDFAPTFAGPVLAMCSTIATLSGFIMPVLMSWFIEEDPFSVELWRHFFWTISGIYICACFIFVTCCTGEIQDWAILSELKVDPEEVS